MAEYKFNKLKIGSDTFISRQVTGDNDSAEPAGALLLSGAGRTDNSPAGDTWIFYDSMGAAATPWGFKHEQKDNFISFYGAGTRTSYINLQTGNIVGSFTGNLTGNVTGNCSGSSGSCTGNAATATSAYNIISSNGTNLLKSNSSGEITITAPTDLLTINSTGKQTYSLLYFSKNGTRKACTGYYEGMAFISNETSPYPRIGVKDDGTPQYWASNSSSTAQTLLHTGNYTTWCATAGHDHDDSYAPISHGIHWNNFLNRALSSAIWGTLTTSNGYTPIFWMDSVNGGGVAFSDYNGQTFMQIDGDYYANEGRSKVWHAGNLTKVSQLTNDANYTTATGHTHSYLPLSGGILTGTSGLTLQNSKLWVQGGSDAGSNSNRMTLDYGAPTDMKYQSGKRGLMLYSNAIAICDPYNGSSNNDSAWIRHIEETANTSVLEIALGDDGDSTEELRFRKYNTSNQIKYDVLVPHKSGTIALTSDIPTSLPASDVYAWAKAANKPSYKTSEVAEETNLYFTNKRAIDACSGTYLTGITKAMVTNALGYTPPTSDTNTWLGDGTWAPGTNVKLSATSNNQEWSFDIERNGKTGCLWHVWDSSLSSLLMVTPDDGIVEAPYGFKGSLSGNASSATLLKPNSGITTAVATWNPLSSFTKCWGQNFASSSLSSDTGDILYYLRRGDSGYGSSTTTELCVCIDGDYYGKGGGGTPKKVSYEDHTHSSIKDVGNSTNTTFAYSKAGLNYSDYTWLAGWNGYELRAVNKSQFAQASHTHNYIPTGGGVAIGSFGSRYTNGYFSGSVYAASGFYESSDERLKDIQAPLTTDLEKLSHLRKVYFNFKEDPSKTHIGVIAQDIKELYPEIVTETDEGTLNVDYSKLSVIALDAIDTLHKENIEIKKENEEIKKRLEKLESLLLNQ